MTMSEETFVWYSPTHGTDWWTDIEVQMGEAPADVIRITLAEFYRRKAREVHATWGILGDAYVSGGLRTDISGRQLRLVKAVVRPEEDTIGYNGKRIRLAVGTFGRVRHVCDEHNREREGDIMADFTAPEWALVGLHADEFVLLPIEDQGDDAVAPF